MVAAQCHCVALYCHLFKRLRDSATMLSHLARSLSHETQTIALFYNLNSDIINISLFRCCYSTNLFLCTNHTSYLLASFIQGAHRQPHLVHPLALVPHLVTADKIRAQFLLILITGVCQPPPNCLGPILPLGHDLQK